MRLSISALSGTFACLFLLAGCEQLGIEDPAKVAASREAEGKAVGAACRHAGRAIEDCYSLNAKAQKAAVFSGWKEMNDYMRENKIEAVVPQLAAGSPKTGKSADGSTEIRADAAQDTDARAADSQEAKTHGDAAKQSKAGSRNAKG